MPDAITPKIHFPGEVWSPVDGLSFPVWLSGVFVGDRVGETDGTLVGDGVRLGVFVGVLVGSLVGSGVGVSAVPFHQTRRLWNGNLIGAEHSRTIPRNSAVPVRERGVLCFGIIVWRRKERSLQSLLKIILFKSKRKVYTKPAQVHFCT